MASGYPDFPSLSLLVLQAVFQLVCVSAPGYILARRGKFPVEAQKLLANLNVRVFTPCLGKFIISINCSLRHHLIISPH